MTLSQSEQQKQRRRSVLKAVAGAPVIFTLSAGTDVAAASISCKVKNQTALPTPVGATTSSDTWIRYKVQRQSITITKKSDGTTSNTNKAFTLDNINWYRVNNTTGIVTTVNLLDYTVSAPSPRQGEFYYLLVDHTKYIGGGGTQSFVYLGTDISTIDRVAGGSCWNSLATGVTVGSNNVIN